MSHRLNQAVEGSHKAPLRLLLRSVWLLWAQKSWSSTHRYLQWSHGRSLITGIKDRVSVRMGMILVPDTLETKYSRVIARDVPLKEQPKENTPEYRYWWRNSTAVILVKTLTEASLLGSLELWSSARVPHMSLLFYDRLAIAGVLHNGGRPACRRSLPHWAFKALHYLHDLSFTLCLWTTKQRKLGVYNINILLGCSSLCGVHLGETPEN